MIVSERWRTRLAWLLGIALLLRLLTLAAYPLMETTEPRYAEIARKMLETGNWVTPWFDHGVPFWGKPPMSFWGSAATMAVFGVNEFGARLAPFLATLATLALLWSWPRGAGTGRALPLAAGLITVTSLVGFVSAGAVMTDMFMIMGTTLCMVAFWRALQDDSARTPWRWAFFVGIAIGLLAKGPVATVLTGLALAPWVVLRGAWRATWQRLPWLRGSLLAVVLTLPWYLLAESRTPGFLNYFLIGEHLQRFLVSGWSGDLYGHPHTEPRGTVWWFLLAGCMPWTLLLMAAPALLWRQSRTDSPPRPSPVLPAGEAVYLLCWALATPVFFSMSRNVLPPYVLPGLPAFALLTAILALAAADRAPRLHLAWLAGLLLPVLVTLGLLLFPELPQARSQRELLQHWHRGEPLAYLGPRPFSAGFYSQGQARWLRQPQETAQWLSSAGPATLVLERSILAGLSAEQLKGWNKVAEHADYIMLRRAPGP
jgi:4-amino-4-deoxy-L-arabinose transferase-like glycosyltransferase